MELATIWFAVIAFFWVGYLVLEGFDFGVGILLRVVGRGATDRAAMLRTIGPVWDGNEVWLVVAIGATFAAFPLWYATLLSAFYLPMLLILVALIGRGVAIEFRGKLDDERWRNGCDIVVSAGSLVPAATWGAVFSTLVHGLPVDGSGEYVGSPFVVDGVPALLGAVAVLCLCVVHGSAFLALRTTDALRHRANLVTRVAGPVSVVAVIAFLGQVQLSRGGLPSAVVGGSAVLALVLAQLASWRHADGWAFAGTTAGVLFTVAAVFVALFPDVLPSTLDPAWSHTVTEAAAQPYALRTMSVVAGVFAPLVLAYQGWSYWVFRRSVVAS